MLEARMWQEPTRLITMKERDMLSLCLTATNVRYITKGHRAPIVNQRVGTCFECGSQGHFKKDYPKLKKQNRGNKAGTRQIKLEGRHMCWDEENLTPITTSSRVRFFSTITILLCYLIMSTFSALLDVIPSTLDVSYAIELADGRVAETNIMLRGCTFGFLGHPFNIDLMPVELSSFNIIIDMDWLANHHAVIVWDEKIMRIPYGDEKYIKKGCQTFLAQVTKKETKDKSEDKRPNGDAPVARAPYRLAPSELQELSTQLQEL
ncbi:putative reverse transcriptase domain-containing protein [Tanacetum coccineum]